MRTKPVRSIVAKPLVSRVDRAPHKPEERVGKHPQSDKADGNGDLAGSVHTDLVAS